MPRQADVTDLGMKNAMPLATKIAKAWDVSVRYVEDDLGACVEFFDGAGCNQIGACNQFKEEAEK